MWRLPSVVARIDFGGDSTSAEVPGKDEAQCHELSVPVFKLYCAVGFLSH